VERGQEPAAVVDAFIEAYNARDFEALSRLLGESIRLVHYGRNIDVTGRAEVRAMFERSAEGAFPDRRFHSRRRRIVDGDHVVIEQVWEATASIDVPNMAHAGEAVRMDLCTIFTVRDSRIVAYDEYG
jgi:limonene-1,2-epoxide hydrolase